ncbi:hypothetical protein N7517_011449 [Penicillium concentricum]|uniref:Uncharacterized protein n=1 Tax=Penicillium concentricum TaxID=293559 RepID=A0A9W9RAT0_9EURO|nr:uncharacterized protein N7517_011449 [Penicillium concentricum]KAJ5356840.1 hypothetical protein N7517_011449 [Penicillium concentricum]
MAKKSQDTDSEGPRGRTGRPETPSSANSSSRRSTLSRVHFADDVADEMCNPLASPRSDVTVTAVPVPVPSKSANPTVGLPSSVGENWELPPPSVDKRNAFAQQKAKLASQSSSHLSSHPSHFSRRSSSIPPVPSLPVSILKNRHGNLSIAEVKPRSFSAPPSPPKMEDSPDVPEGKNKPLPMSPPGKFEPHTPSPRTPIFNRDGLRTPILGSPFSPTGVSPVTSNRSSFATLKDLPETVRTLQYQYEATQKRLATKIDDINRLEKKVEDFFTLTENYIKDQMHAQVERNSDLSFELSKFKRENKKTMDQVNQIKESIHEMRLEINGLTSTVNDLSAKVDMCLTGIWENTEEPFVAYQRRKNSEIDEDLQDIGNMAVNNGAQLLFVRQSIIRMQIAFRLLQHENNLNVSQDVQLVLPQFPLATQDNVPPTGQLQSLATFEPGAAPPASTTVPANATRSASTTVPANVTPPASRTVPARATPGNSTSSGSTTVPANVTPPASRTVPARATPANSTSSGSTVTVKPTPAKSTSSASPTVRGKATPPASATVPAKNTLSGATTVPKKVTPPASATGSATIISPESSSAKSSIPRPKETLSKKSVGSQSSDKENIRKYTGGYADSTSGSAAEFKAKKDAIDKQHGSEKKGKSLFGFRRRSDSLSSGTSGKAPRASRQEESIPPVPPLPRGIVLPGVPGEPIPLANIHPLYRPGFREVNALGIPSATPIVPPRPAQPKGSPESGKDKTRK